jgi:hypothetical protein
MPFSEFGMPSSIYPGQHSKGVSSSPRPRSPAVGLPRRPLLVAPVSSTTEGEGQCNPAREAAPQTVCTVACRLPYHPSIADRDGHGGMTRPGLQLPAMASHARPYAEAAVTHGALGSLP